MVEERYDVIYSLRLWRDAPALPHSKTLWRDVERSSGNGERGVAAGRRWPVHSGAQPRRPRGDAGPSWSAASGTDALATSACRLALPHTNLCALVPAGTLPVHSCSPARLQASTLLPDGSSWAAGEPLAWLLGPPSYPGAPVYPGDSLTEPSSGPWDPLKAGGAPNGRWYTEGTPDLHSRGL